MKEIKKYLAVNFKDSFIVGGSLRDALLGRASYDIDIALPKANIQPRVFNFAKAFKGAFFPLDEENGVYRVIFKQYNNMQFDFASFQGSNISEDILKRDFTINALAYPLTLPFAFEPREDNKFQITGIKKEDVAGVKNALADLDNKIIKPVTSSSFTDDPLRLLRLFRIAYELNFKISPASKTQAKKHCLLINNVSGERIREELLRILETDGVEKHLKELYSCGLLTALFPDLQAQRACALEYYGKGGVLKHTFLVCGRLEFLLNNLKRIFPQYPALAEYLKQAALLKFIALMHDIAKPKTAKFIDGRLRFFHHDAKGAKMTQEIMRKLRFSNAETDLAGLIISEHLRAGNLAANRVITDRGVYRFFRQNKKSGIPLLLVCWADHTSYITLKQLEKILPLIWQTPSVAVPKEMPQQGVQKTLKHLQVINLMFKLYYSRPEKINPATLLTGLDVMRILNITPGPKVGKILNRLKIAQVDGKVSTKEEAEIFIKKIA